MPEPRLSSKRAAPLCAPYALRREYAALHVGVSAGYFDKLVEKSLMPPPREMDGVKVWIRGELELAVESLPTTADAASGNSWDDVI